MRKTKSDNSNQNDPASGIPTTVDEYLVGVEEPARSVLVKMRRLIQSVLPAEATEIISYRMPAFKHKKTLVWFAAFSNHCSLFPTGAAIAALKDELKGYDTAKGTIHFPIDKPLPAALIKKVVKTRLEQSGTVKAGPVKSAGKQPRKVAAESARQVKGKRA